MSTTPTGPCASVLAQLAAYLDGEADAATCAAIEDHCRTCPACADVVDGLRRTTGLCRQVGAKPLPPEVRARARAAVARLLAETDSGQA